MHAIVRPTPRLRRKQSGYALLMFAVLLALGLMYAVLSDFDGITLRLTREQRTAQALTRAKEALIAWSVSHGDISSSTSDRPGELPCPDTHTPGSMGFGTEDTVPFCGPGSIGRLPWRTLGIDELRDGNGETLWYAIDGNFRQRQGSLGPKIINSDSQASLAVYAADTSTLLTPSGQELAAVIFAPGPPLAGQARGTATEQNNIANYLESASTAPPRNNTATGGPFIQGPVLTTDGTIIVNDSLLGLSARELIHAAEVRVAGTAKKWLYDFDAATHSTLPHPAKYDDAQCIKTTGAKCVSDSTQCRGRFPECADSITAHCDPTLYPSQGWGILSLPKWFTANQWAQTIYYSVGDSYLPAPTHKCSGSLSVDGRTTRAIIAFAGSPQGTTRKNLAAIPITESIKLADYLLDPDNKDGWGPTPDDVYVTPTPSTRNWLMLFN